MTTQGPWKVTINVIDGRAVYGVYRIIDPDEPEHSGNREVLDYFESREAAQDCADAFNRAGVGAKVDAGSGYSGGIEDIDEPAEEPSGFDAPEGLQLPIDSIDLNPLNPRKHFDEEKLRELAQSIKEMGLLQPLVVTESNRPGRYLLIAGERRLRACKMIGLTHVPAIFCDTDLEARGQMALMLIENLQREDLDPIEEARAFEVLTRDHGWKQTDLAEKIGVSQSHIANRIRLLNLPASVQEGISEGKVTASVGKELATYARVPGVCEALDEAMSEDEDDAPEDLVWEARSAAYSNVRALHSKVHPEPQFDLGSCERCKERIMLPGRWSDDGERLPWCTNVSCWNEKQEKAIEEAAERAKQQAIDAGEEVVQLGALPGSAYKSFGMAGGFDTAECTQCEHHRKGRHGWMDEDDEPISICINPECFNAKQKAHDKEVRLREKAIKDAHEERKESLIARFFPQALFDEDIDQDSPDFQALVYMTAEAVLCASGWYVKSAEMVIYERYGWKKPEGLSWGEWAQHLVQQLATLTAAELLRVILFVMLKPTAHDGPVFQAVYGEGEIGDGDDDQ